jgi:hypothetical protein
MMQIENPGPAGRAGHGLLTTLRLPLPPRPVSAACLLLAALLLVPRVSFVPAAHAQSAAPGAAQPAGTDAKAAAAPARQQVVLPGGREDGSDLAINLPAWPEDRDLAELQQSVRPDLRFFVDRRSIELVPGGEFRFTLVARTASGSRNVTFEAIRCATRDRMMLAVGSPDRRWSPARFMRWEPVERNDPIGMRDVLWRDIFCPGRQPLETLKEVMAVLKTGLPRDLVPLE